LYIRYFHQTIIPGVDFYKLPESVSKNDESNPLKDAGEYHIRLWKNNTLSGDTCFFNVNQDKALRLRLHLWIEDIIMQIIFIEHQNMIYEFESLCEPKHPYKCTKKFDCIGKIDCPN